MTDLSKLSDDDLKAELTRRQEARRVEENARRTKESAFYKAHIHELLALTPNHERTSCSDANACNGGHDYERAPRCARCFLLELAANEWQDWPDELKVNLTLELRPEN